MNGMCKILDGFFGAIRSGDDGWAAVYVFRDGNEHVIEHFATEEEAEDAAGTEHQRQLQARLARKSA